MRMSLSKSTLFTLSDLEVGFDEAVDDDERATPLIASMRACSVPDILVWESEDENHRLSILIAQPACQLAKLERSSELSELLKLSITRYHESN